jgi:hypothetical protein
MLVTCFKAVLCQYQVGLLIVLIVFDIRDVSFVGSTAVFAFCCCCCCSLLVKYLFFVPDEVTFLFSTTGKKEQSSVVFIVNSGLVIMQR